MIEPVPAVHVECAAVPPPDWDAYVAAHADGSPFHLGEAVLVGQRSFGLPVHFLSTRHPDGRLRGVLPLVEQLQIPRTRCLVSLPFCTYGGPLADDEPALAGLMQAAVDLAGERRALRLLIRRSSDTPAIPWPAALDKVAMVLPLPETKDELAQRLGSKLRSQIRRADREKPVTIIGHAELLGDFYTVFCSVMRDLGTPVYPRRFFDAVLAALGEHALVVVIYLGDRPVSAAILVQWHDGIEIPWAATLHAVNRLSINMRLYWDVLQLAIDRGCSRFDFGRYTPGSGTYRFKAQWGAHPVQLYWQAWAPDGAASAASASGNRSKFDAAVKLWSRMPLWMANALGPCISPRLPW